MFTQVQILEIKDKLAAFGKKDSALPSVNLPLEGDEEISFIQNGLNVRMRLNDLITHLLRYRILSEIEYDALVATNSVNPTTLYYIYEQ